MINWLLGFLPAPLKYAINGIGIIAYLIALIKPGSAVSGICMAIATITGAASLISAAKESMKDAKLLTQSARSEQGTKLVHEGSSEASVGGTGSMKVDGHSVEAAEDYKGNIFQP